MFCKCGGELELESNVLNSVTCQCKVCGEKTKFKLFQPAIKDPQFMFVKYRRKL